MQAELGWLLEHILVSTRVHVHGDALPVHLVSVQLVLENLSSSVSKRTLKRLLDVVSSHRITLLLFTRSAITLSVSVDRRINTLGRLVWESSAPQAAARRQICMPAAHGGVSLLGK